MTATSVEQLRTALSDRYRIERELGQGGMATVYLAHDLKHDRHVALKVLRPELAATMGADRFLREVRIAANLSHPHILPLYDSGEAGGFLFYVMPFVDGESLRARLHRDGELPIAEAVRILKEVVDALAYAHAHKVVHRDIKPDNVLLSGRHALVSDFGVAKAVSEATGRQTLTTAGVALGTPAYMAPEQATADPHVDHRADIYAVGVLAYEILTGRVPFNETTAQGMLAAHVTQVPEPVTAHRAAVPAPLAQIVMRCLEKKPADRWQSAEDLLPQLEALATPSGGMTPTEARPATASRVPKRGVTWALMAIAAAVLVVGGFLGVRAFSRAGRVTLDPNALAVLPFRVTGDPSLADLREGMMDILHARFTGEGGPRAVDPRTILSAWRQVVPGDETDLALDAALPVAERVGAGQLLLGGIVETAGQLGISASLHEVPEGRELATASVSGPRDSLPRLIDQLAIRLLSLQAGEGQARLSTISGSVEAVRAYLAGQQTYRRGRMLEAVGHFDRAVALDSSFALAVLGLIKAGIAAGNTNTDAVGRAAPVMGRLRDSLSTRDRALVMAFGRNLPAWTSLAQRIADAERAVELAPDDAFAWTLLGSFQAEMAGYLADSAGLRNAAAVLDRAVALDSTFVAALDARLQSAVRLGDTGAIRRLRDRRLAVDSVGESVEFWRWRAALALGDPAELAAARELLGTTTQISLTRIGYATVYDGLTLDDWVLATERFSRRAVTARARDQAMEQRRKIAMIQGRAADAVAISDSLIARGFFPGPLRGYLVQAAIIGPGYESAAAREVERFLRLPDAAYAPWCFAGLWGAQTGKAAGVQQVLGRLDQLVRNGAHPICPLLLRTMLDAQRGNASPATLDALDSLMNLDTPGNSGIPLVASLVIARLREHQGDLEAALRAIRRRGAGSGDVGPQLVYPALLKEEGRIAALAGDTAGAMRAYQHFLTLRTHPDSSVRPEVDEVKAALARLGGERPR
ncbi:MAG TPA: serine/threonine-protein kinase [Gemmatimonadales bacterium]